jgi:selenocysteine lyase/cysteine desulfurase
MQRRNFLNLVTGTASLRAGAVARAAAATRSVAGRDPEEVARDEDYWREIQMSFTVDRTFINLNNGSVSPSPRVVQDAVRRYQEISNMNPAHFQRTLLEPQVESVRRRLAGVFGCDSEELAITRNASEALETVQLGLDHKPGDEVLTTDQDYPRMLTTWRQREQRDGIVLKMISFPVPPPSQDDLYRRLEQAITPRTKVILFCHMTFVTGQIFPVGQICRMARRRGIETIVDGAHAFAHIPFKCSDLDCDYYGTSLHKWMLAPQGTGFLYVRREKIRKLWPLMAAPDRLQDNIRKFEEIGTHPAANHNAIAEALTFHETIGVERKSARLRFLRSLWEERLLRFSNVKLFTSRDPQQSCGLALVGVEGRSPQDLYQKLFDEHRIITVPIVRRGDFEGLRITPNIYTTVQEIDVFSTAMERIIRQG